MSEMRPLPKYRDDLVALVKAYNGTIKRDVCNVYRRQLPNGRLSPPRFEKSVKYAKDAYRADKKKARALPLGISHPREYSAHDKMIGASNKRWAVEG